MLRWYDDTFREDLVQFLQVDLEFLGYVLDTTTLLLTPALSLQSAHSRPCSEVFVHGRCFIVRTSLSAPSAVDNRNGDKGLEQLGLSQRALNWSGSLLTAILSALLLYLGYPEKAGQGAMLRRKSPCPHRVNRRRLRESHLGEGNDPRTIGP